MVNRFMLQVAGILVFWACCGYSAAAEYIDRVVAVVNDDVITLSELEKAGGQIFESIRKQASAGEAESALQKARSEILSSMIDNMIVRQKAKDLSISVEQPEIDMAISQMLARINAPYEEFRKELAKMNVSEQDYRDNLRDQILKSKLIGYQVSSRIVITEKDIKKYYEKDYAPGAGEDGYYILQMGFSWDNPGAFAGGASLKEAARSRAEGIRARVLAGESFKELAGSYSELPSAADGGDIGVITKEEMGAGMRDAIMAIHPGEVSPIIETNNTFQFFKLLSVREGNVVVKAPFDAVKNEIRDMLYQREMEAEYNAWVESLRSQAYIKIQL